MEKVPSEANVGEVFKGNGNGAATATTSHSTCTLSAPLPSSLPVASVLARVLAGARVGGCAVLEERREVAQE